MVQKYKVLNAENSSGEVTEGQIVYELMKHDYGLASDDTRFTGIQHISVTHDVNGDYPSFTIPVAHLEEVV